MISFARKMLYTDCYAENILTQMSLLKPITHLTFELSDLNGIVDKKELLKEENEHFKC